MTSAMPITVFVLLDKVIRVGAVTGKVAGATMIVVGAASSAL